MDFDPEFHGHVFLFFLLRLMGMHCQCSMLYN